MIEEKKKNTPLKDRLLEYISYKEMKQSAFEKRIGASPGFIAHIGNKIGSDKLQRIIREFPDLDINWLQTGKGEMINKDIESVEESPETILTTIALGMQEERRRHDEHISEMLDQQSRLIDQQERLIALLEKSNVRETDAAKCADAAS